MYKKDTEKRKKKVEKIIQELKKLSLYKVAKTSRYSLGRQDYIKHREVARTLIKNRIDHLNKVYKYSYGKISIRNQKTRWGSCSNKGNLNFNYKLLFLSEISRDYVIAHELCHLKEFNHSKKFWELVSLTIPNHRAVRKELKKSGLTLK